MSSVSERAMSARRPRREARRPDFIVRAPDPQNRGRWLTLGAAWSRDDGGLNIKLNVMPVANFDGTLVALPPLESDEVPEYDINTGEIIR